MSNIHIVHNAPVMERNEIIRLIIPNTPNKEFYRSAATTEGLVRRIIRWSIVLSDGVKACGYCQARILESQPLACQDDTCGRELAYTVVAGRKKYSRRKLEALFPKQVVIGYASEVKNPSTLHHLP